MRPEGWENPYIEMIPVRRGDCTLKRNQKYDVFEAGADAYEEGLKKEGSRLEVDGNAVTFTIPDNKGKNGFLVFIEEG